MEITGKEMTLAVKAMLSGPPHIVAVSKDGDFGMSAEGTSADILKMFGHIMADIMKHLELDAIDDLLRAVAIAFAMEKD